MHGMCRLGVTEKLLHPEHSQTLNRLSTEAGGPPPCLKVAPSQLPEGGPALRWELGVPVPVLCYMKPGAEAPTLPMHYHCIFICQ